MKAIMVRWGVVIGVALFLSGCASTKMRGAEQVIMGYDEIGSPIYGPETVSGGNGSLAPMLIPDSDPDRMIAWQAWVTVEVPDASNAVAQVMTMVEDLKGIVDSSSQYRSQNITISMRIPSKAFRDAMGRIDALGEVTSRRVSSEDVTEQYVDLEARIKNRDMLRDRLRELLDQASEVKDILAIETELNRVQGDIDAMEARIRSLKGTVDYSKIDITIEQKDVPPKKILGPLGWLFKGVFWTVEKLFVIRE